MRVLLAVALLAACAPREAPTTLQQAQRIADSVIPRVERAVGLRFRSPPVLGVRQRAQVERYLIERLDQEYPPARMARVSAAYRRFGVLPDTVDLRLLLLAVLKEQVIGYYDPDSTTLYLVAGTDETRLQVVLAHELVHALQGQYLPLDSILTSPGDNDGKLAAQAILEGQATYAGLLSTVDEDQLRRFGSFWDDVREGLRSQQEQMATFAAAPLIVREGLLFPYLVGADFMRWFARTYPDTQPYGPRMPRSTEQVLHPERYQAGDEPTRFAIEAVPALGPPWVEDDWGEFETRLVLQQLTGSESLGAAGALGWDGDRYALYRADATDALVWWTVWDSGRAAASFATLLDRYWSRRMGSGRRWKVDRDTVGQAPAVRLTDAPDAWVGWARLPRVVLAGGGATAH